MTMLVGVVGAVVLASAAGAHRSSTSLQRFVAYSRSSDVEMDVNDPTPAQLQAFGRVPEVADFAVLHAYGVIVHDRPNLKNAATVDGRLGTVVDRARLVSGRVADPRAPDEIMIGEGLAAQQHLGVGDHLVADSMTPAQFAEVMQGKDPGAPAGTVLRLRIVGIYRRPLDLGDLAAVGGVVIETPAFDRTYTGRIARWSSVLRVRTRHGARDVPRVAAAARQVFGPQSGLQVRDVSAESHGAADAINVLTLALWIFAGVAAVAGAVAIAIVLSRDVSQAEIDQPTLTALGMTRRQSIATLGLRVLLIVVGGAVVATVVAIAASPMFPIGIARRADPSPGVRVDWIVLGAGLVGIAAFVGVIGFLAAARASRASSAAVAARAPRPHRTIAEMAAKAGASPSATNGLRMALEPGRGASTVPVRSAFFGAVFGVVGLTAVLVFATSLGHLDSDPRLYGWTWDFKAPDNTFTSDCSAADYGLSKVPGVAAVAAVCYQLGVLINGRPTTGWGFTPVRGRVEPEIVTGRAPSGPSEVALGAATLHALRKSVGDTVQVRGAKAAHDYRIVGQVVLPQLQDGEIQPLSDGAAFTGEGFAPLADQSGHTRYLIGTFAARVDRAAVVRRIDRISQFQPSAGQGSFASERGASGPTRPPEIGRLREIDWFPPTLAVLVAGLALVAVGHALVTTAHRRRSELALLKTLGFERRQVRATLAWQATTLAVVGLVLGLPVGVLVGSVVWRHVADSLGILPVAIVPVVALAVTVPCVIALVNLVGFGPARKAARTWPADALTAE